MGRYYDGNISGKFWVGAQSSFSMNKFGATDKDRYEYACCGCHFDKGDTDYCQSCYESKEEHLEAVHEDEPDVDICFIEVPESDFEITKKDFEEKGLPFLQENEELWKNKVDSFEIQDDGYDCCLVGGWKTDATREEESIIADMCMLKQIQKYFEDNVNVDVCSWVAEN